MKLKKKINNEWHLIQRAVKETTRNGNIHSEYYYIDITAQEVRQ